MEGWRCLSIEDAQILTEDIMNLRTYIDQLEVYFED